MPFKWSGAKQMLGTLRAIPKKFPDEVGAALYYVGQRRMTQAKRRTPVWNPERPVPAGHTPGSLRASGQVHEPEREGRNVSVALSFGNEIVDYAIYVHEDLEAHHATGQAKFLESVLMEGADSTAKEVAERIDLKRAVE